MFFFRSGFTIIEMLMVILVAGILAAVALPQFIDFSSDARIQMTREKLNDLKLAISGDPRLVAGGQYVKPGFENQVGSLPASLDSLVTQGAYANYDPFTKRGWNGPYVSNANTNWKQDAWGTDIQYTSATRALTSCGPDKTCGNGDDIVVYF